MLLLFHQEWLWRAVLPVGYITLAMAVAWTIRHFWLAFRPVYRARWQPDVPIVWGTGIRRRHALADRLLLPRNPDKIGEYRQLLLEAGFPVPATAYLKVRRAAIMIAVLGFFGYVVLQMLRLGGSLLLLPGIACGLIVAGIWSDRLWIGYFARRRSGQMTEEMHAICRQLLYYSGSRMSLHARLMKCTPFAKRMRKAWVMLLHEWYEDPGEALFRFRNRVGTEDVHGFAETLNALRLNEYDGYYELLHRRIQDYKEKMELARESRKETFSHLLFVLAGLPILNTFRVFVHPWMEAGKRMFESLQ